MRPIRPTVDFARIEALPRRILAAASAVEDWSDYFRHAPGAALRPRQSQALQEIFTNDGAYLALPVGLGKTLILALAPIVLASERPVMLVPASLLAKTLSDLDALRQSWPDIPHIEVVTFSALAAEAGKVLLTALAPDVLLIDECDDLANTMRGAPRRIDRYLVAAQDSCRVVCATGTPGRKSILAYHHALLWCLRDRAPMPMRASEAKDWALALDEFKGEHLSPGVLGPTLAAARSWFAARLRETPGVMIVDEDSAAGVPLTIRVRIAPESPAMNAVFERFMLEGENPAGIPVSEPLERYRVEAQLGTGLYLKWTDPQPPPAWLEARKASAAFVRRTVSHGQKSDTEGEVYRNHPTNPTVTAWLAIRDTYVPRTEAVWFTEDTLHAAMAWLREDASPGIVWVGGVEFGRALARHAGLPYYGRLGRDAAGRGLHEADPARSLIASWNANKKGFNLQPWRRALVIQPPSSAKWVEQLIGRHHRAGQTHPVVVDILATSGGVIDLVETVLREAKFAKATLSLTQKILRADVIRMYPTVMRESRYRWATRSNK